MDIGPWIAPNRFNAEIGKSRDQILHATFGIADKSRSPASPEPPTHSFKRLLSTKILRPTLRPVVLITVEFDRKASIVLAFNNEIDPITAGSNLWLDPIADRNKAAIYLSFEPRLAK
jgi:hypothetical protein